MFRGSFYEGFYSGLILLLMRWLGCVDFKCSYFFLYRYYMIEGYIYESLV